MKNKLLYLFAASTILFGACKKGYLDINDNPNNSTSASSSLVLTGALNNTASSTTGNTIFYTFAAQWMNYWATTGGVSGWAEERTYNFTSNWGGSTVLWANLYDNLEDYYYIEPKAKAEGKDFYVAIAKTMKAWDYGYLVDFYGNIPYSQALQSTKFITPKYDKAQDIYEDLALQLDSAAAIFKTVTVSPGDKAFDIYAKGDPLAWGRFANTIKLRLLLRQSEMPGRDTYIKAEIAKITANGMGYIGEKQGIKCNPGYLNSTGKQNPFYSYFGYTIASDSTAATGRGYYLASNYGLDFLQDNGDPRLGKLYTRINDNKGRTYASLTFGGDPSSDDTRTNISAIGTGLIKTPDQDQPILTDFESLFLQAEAAQRGYIAGSAQDFYRAAVTANFVYLGLTAEEATAYLDGQAVADWNDESNPNKITLIIKQKWAAMNGTNDIEPWSDYRRLEIPSDLPISVAPGVTTRKIPVRMLYPQNEYNFNSANAAAEGTISQFNTRLFWDVK